MTDDEFDAELPFTENAVELFSSLEAARRLGSAYLALRPEEGTEDRLVALLEESNAAWRDLWKAQGDVSRIAHEATRRDFADGRVVSIEGWSLSLTEARLCALTTFG